MQTEVSLRRGTNGDHLYPVLSIEVDAGSWVDLKLSVSDYNLMIRDGKNPLDFLASILKDLEELEHYKSKFLNQVEKIRCYEIDLMAHENIIASLTEQLELLQGD